MFIVIELQTNDGQTANIVQSKETKAEAMSTYHSILAAAAISAIHCHTAMVIDHEGKVYAREFYTHMPEPEPENEVEQNG